MQLMFLCRRKSLHVYSFVGHFTLYCATNSVFAAIWRSLYRPNPAVPNPNRQHVQTLHLGCFTSNNADECKPVRAQLSRNNRAAGGGGGGGGAEAVVMVTE